MHGSWNTNVMLNVFPLGNKGCYSTTNALLTGLLELSKTLYIIKDSNIVLIDFPHSKHWQEKEWDKMITYAVVNGS